MKTAAQFQKQTNNKMERFFSMECRAAQDASARTFEISFSSEEPYQRWDNYAEILDHADGAVDLSRLQEIGVVLFNHDRDKVIGKITRAWIEDGRGKALIEFDSDDKSEVIRQKVESGTLKGVSVGYIVSVWEEVAAGGTSVDGRFVGACEVARKWMPYEVSIVSIPADACVGVGRELTEPAQEQQQHEEAHSNLSVYDAQISINKNI